MLKQHMQSITEEMQAVLKEYTKLDQLIKKYTKVSDACYNDTQNHHRNALCATRLSFCPSTWSAVSFSIL